MSYVYWQTERTLWTVGFYDPKGQFHPESDHGSPDAAADRTAWLNGSDYDLRAQLKASYAENERLAALFNKETEHS